MVHLQNQKTDFAGTTGGSTLYQYDMLDIDNYKDFAACGSTLEIFYAFDPASPVFKGSVALSGDYTHIVLDGQFAYLAGSESSDSVPIRCSIWPPDDPAVVESFPGWTYGGTFDMLLYNNVLYLATERGIRIFSLLS